MTALRLSFFPHLPISPGFCLCTSELWELGNRIMGSEERMSVFSAVGLLFILQEEGVPLEEDPQQWGLALKFQHQQEPGRQRAGRKRAESHAVGNEGLWGPEDTRLVCIGSCCGLQAMVARWEVGGGGVSVARSSFLRTRNLECFCGISSFPNVGNNLKHHCLKPVQAK